MFSKGKNDKRMSRGKFFGFLGKVGVLSFLGSLPLFGAEKFELKPTRKVELEKTESKIEKVDFLRLTRSPTIKGRKLSRTALTATLATQGLEDIRDVLTGRFFGKAAQEAFKDGYVPMINWNIGTADNDSGCFIYACADKVKEVDPGIAENCSLFVSSYVEEGKYIIEAFSHPVVGANWGPPGSEACSAEASCPDRCGSQCSDYCAAVCDSYCITHCKPVAKLDMYAIVSYPADKFASELMDILGTTEIETIQQELKVLIFSDDVLNMGLEHFVVAAHESLEEEIERFEVGF